MVYCLHISSEKESHEIFNNQKKKKMLKHPLGVGGGGLEEFTVREVIQFGVLIIYICDHICKNLINK